MLPSDETEIRLQKVLAAAGYGSRREIEALIEAGRVLVNDEPAVLGMKVDVSDSVSIDGKPCQLGAASAGSGRVIGVHKPADVVCTRHDPEGRATIFDLLPATARRWVMVGRLDLTTSGLVLFTDDGELAHRLTHPSYQIPRRYAVRVLGTPEAETLAAMLAGVDVDGEVLRFDRIAAAGGDGANRWFDCTLHTGRNREVRRLWEAHGMAVSRLMRISYGALSLQREVRPGAWFEVEGQPLTRLYESVGLTPPGAAPQPTPAMPISRRGRATPARPVKGGVKKKAAERTARIDYITPEQRALRGPRRRRNEDAPVLDRAEPRSGRPPRRPAPGARPEGRPAARRDGESAGRPFGPRAAEGRGRAGDPRPSRERGPARPRDASSDTRRPPRDASSDTRRPPRDASSDTRRPPRDAAGDPRRAPRDAQAPEGRRRAAPAGAGGDAPARRQDQRPAPAARGTWPGKSAGGSTREGAQREVRAAPRERTERAAPAGAGLYRAAPAGRSPGAERGERPPRGPRGPDDRPARPRRPRPEN